ncbi:hypothetical protein B0T25DRAFT_565509 [Lasiosphaeria hispida]|uniref:Uncharacterized protein n=1 Tax=Lasiosphaeria hispida TaxID=260671 RepID=A0AAJ0HSH1_9PEZI|nr:hypothetical protein B0T25DRAFT_565509 [Lasiosphaeria hispida]
MGDAKLWRYDEIGGKAYKAFSRFLATAQSSPIVFTSSTHAAESMTSLSTCSTMSTAKRTIKETFTFTHTESGSFTIINVTETSVGESIMTNTATTTPTTTTVSTITLVTTYASSCIQVLSNSGFENPSRELYPWRGAIVPVRLTQGMSICARLYRVRMKYNIHESFTASPGVDILGRFKDADGDGLPIITTKDILARLQALAPDSPTKTHSAFPMPIRSRAGMGGSMLTEHYEKELMERHTNGRNVYFN